MQKTADCGAPWHARYNIAKTMRVMRLTVFLLTAVFLHTYASGTAQPVSISGKDLTLKQVFTAIKKQTGYVVFSSQELFLDKKPLSLDVKDMPLSKLLDMILDGRPFEYSISDKTIFITKRPPPATAAAPAPLVDQQASLPPIRILVVDSIGHPLAGASVTVKNSKLSGATDAEGALSMEVKEGDMLVVSFVGHQSQQIKVTRSILREAQLSIKLYPAATDLGGVAVVVSTGYETIPRERATGSFEVITKEQLKHSTDPNLIRRLEGITTSMDFRNDLRPVNSSNPNNRQSPLVNLTIRGKNTLNYSTENNSGQVLVVIDGIATPYSIDQVNPNDVESITILKDAAAASIWGARAANGVLVIKTKRGSYNRKAQISFNSSVSVTDKMDLFYNKTMPISDFVDAQVQQFSKMTSPLPDVSLSSLYGQEPVAPVIEIMDAWKNKGTLTEKQAADMLDALRKNDIRKDYTKYFLRPSVVQSYSLGVDGGNAKMNYRFSAGYDKSINNTRSSGSDRISLSYNTSVRPVKNLELQANISYHLQRYRDQAAENRITGATDATFYPYTKLTNADGSAAVIPKLYRPGMVDLMESTYGDKLLSFRYKPLEDINEGYNKTYLNNLNLNLVANYRLFDALSAQLMYNYNTGLNNDYTLYRQNSFYMRNLINYYTTSPYSSDPETYDDVPDFVRSLPLGGLYQVNQTRQTNHTGRGQLNFNKIFGDKHEISAIAGFDIAQSYSITRADQYYGYQENSLKTNARINYSTLVPILFAEDFNGYNGEYIPAITQPFADNKVRTFSWYSNAAYTYGRRYTLSVSMRRDLSSEFGRGTNNGGSPYFSVGASWNVSNESFYKPGVFSTLKLRATFGYNGNVNPLVIARPIITYQDFNNNGIPYAVTETSGSVSNSLLRPEKTGILNLGVDFGIKGERLSGTFEYYSKNTKDLLANGALDPSTGYTNTIYNTGNLKGHGLELTVNSTNIKAGAFRWTSNLLVSYNRVKVSKLYASQENSAGNVVTNSGGTYNEGYDLSRVFGYRWAGLDPGTGDPRGFLGKDTLVISPDAAGGANYRSIQNAPLAEAHYFGSAVPVVYGSLRNTVSYGNLSLSFNLLYKLGYYVRRPLSRVVQYRRLFSSTGQLQPIEYVNRWQKPGDEVKTNVPSAAIDGTDANRDNFYYFSDINVLKGDHIRLQEINFSYAPNLKKAGFFKNPRIYANVNNLGILWRSNNQGIDPEVFDYPTPRSYSLGFSMNF